LLSFPQDIERWEKAVPRGGAERRRKELLRQGGKLPPKENVAQRVILGTLRSDTQKGFLSERGMGGDFKEKRGVGGLYLQVFSEKSCQKGKMEGNGSCGGGTSGPGFHWKKASTHENISGKTNTFLSKKKKKPSLNDVLGSGIQPENPIL